MTAPTSAEPPPGPTSAEPSPGATVKRWIGVVASVVAPTTLVTGLLLYFGYVAARATYAYFGLDVDLIGFSTSELVMRSPQPLLVPLVVLLLLGAGVYAADAAWRTHLHHVSARRALAQVRALRWTGLGVLGVALVLLLGFPVVGRWAYYPLVAPLALGVGAGLTAWATAAATSLRRRATPSGSGESTQRAGAEPAAVGRDAGPGVVVALALVLVTCLFWATATLAEWSGRGVGRALARDLGQLPAVVLDTRERLVPMDSTITEEVLPASDGQSYLYRYRGLRLLVQGEGRVFVVPERWSPSGSTYVVPDDDTVRLRFRFVNDPP